MLNLFFKTLSLWKTSLKNEKQSHRLKEDNVSHWKRTCIHITQRALQIIIITKKLIRKRAIGLNRHLTKKDIWVAEKDIKGANHHSSLRK